MYAKASRLVPCLVVAAVLARFGDAQYHLLPARRVDLTAGVRF